MVNNVKQTVKQIFAEYLRINGHRKTPERFAILDAIYSINGHFNINTLYNLMLNQEKFRVSRATLYNTIVLLLDAKLIIKHTFGTTSRYEKTYNCATHHHLVCTSCGRITEYQDTALSDAIARTHLKRFQMTHYALYIYGICSTCAASRTRQRNQQRRKEREEGDYDIGEDKWTYDYDS